MKMKLYLIIAPDRSSRAQKKAAKEEKKNNKQARA
jgi:hypothetical protein